MQSIQEHPEYMRAQNLMLDALGAIDAHGGDPRAFSSILLIAATRLHADLVGPEETVEALRQLMMTQRLNCPPAGRA